MVRWKGWDRVPLSIDTASGTDEVMAIAPLIISASRSTDIPAFYGGWFLNRLRAGHAVWKSPFGGKPIYVSFEKARVFAFWSKNPEPFLQHLGELDIGGYGYFFLFTLNDYEDEGLEPGIPPLDERIRTFIRLSERIGPGRVIWRFDPLLLTDTLTVDGLLDRIQRIAKRIRPFTRGLVISFIDIARYRKVRQNLAHCGYPAVRELTDSEVTALAVGLNEINKRFNLAVAACGERRDLSGYGISRGACIGYDYLKEEFSHDPVLMKFLTTPHDDGIAGAGGIRKAPLRYLKDYGQRSSCGCIVSKDIGQYSTCPHGCVYCYANSSQRAARENYRAFLHAEKEGTYRSSIVE